MTDDRRRRRILLFATLIVIFAGLALRLVGPQLGVPFFIWKYAGSALWATMVYLVVAALAPRLSSLRVASIAFVIAVLVEMFRLHHTPWLDAFRLTMAGKLLIGRVYSPWNMVAYGVGVICGAASDVRWIEVWCDKSNR